MRKYGVVAEQLARELFIEVFNFNGIPATKSRHREVDIWVKIGEKKYVAIKLSLNKDSILGSKGVEAIHRGIVPMWIDGKELQISFVQKNGDDIVRKVLSLIEEIVKIFSLKTFKEPY